MNVLHRNRTQAPDIDSDTGLVATMRVLEAAYAAPVPELTFNPDAAAWPASSEVSRRRWKLALALAVVALAVTAGFALPALREGPESVSAQEILVKAGLAVGSPSVSYHEIRYQEDEGTIEVAEYWYLDERHRRGERRTVRDGRQSLVDGAIVNGEDVWWYRSVDGTVTAIHGRSGGPISVAAVAVGRDISSTLAMYGGDESCQIASLEREDVVVGRRTYVIRVVPAPQNCTRTDSMKTAMEEQARRKMSHTFWIDKQTFVSLRSEHREGDRLVAQTATQRLETGLVIPSSVFSYEAPEGATVQEVTTIADLCRYTGMGCQRP